MNPKELTVVEHMEELRKRLFVVAIFFVMALFAGFYAAKPIIKYIQFEGEGYNLTLNAFSVGDPLTVYLQVTFIVACILVSPVLLYQLWSFITPGLHENERKATLKYIPYAFVLCIAGILFAYYILFPFVMRFMLGLAGDLEIKDTFGIKQYFSFLFKLVIPFGVLFQLPVVAMFVSRIGLVSPQMMVKFRKYAYFVLIVISVFLAPPDFISNVIIAIPLFVLYEISIIIAKVGYRKFEVAETARIKEEEERQTELKVEELLAEQRRQIEEMTKK